MHEGSRNAFDDESDESFDDDFDNGLSDGSPDDFLDDFSDDFLDDLASEIGLEDLEERNDVLVASVRSATGSSATQRIPVATQASHEHGGDTRYETSSSTSQW